MYEYQILNNNTNETTCIFGRSYDAACKKWGINKEEYTLLDWYYVD